MTRAELLAWGGPADRWRSMEPDAVIDHPCLVRPVPVAALFDAARADTAVVEALVARGAPAIRELVERGQREGLRKGVRDLCEALGIEVEPAARAALEGMDVPALEALGDGIKRQRSWPS